MILVLDLEMKNGSEEESKMYEKKGTTRIELNK